MALFKEKNASKQPLTTQDAPESKLSAALGRFLEINAEESYIGNRNFYDEATGPLFGGYVAANKGKLPSDDEMRDLSKSFAHFIDVSAEDAKGALRKHYTEAAGHVFGGYMQANDGKLPSDKEMIEMSRTTRRFMDINAEESHISSSRGYYNEATGPIVGGYMVAHKGKLPSDEEMLGLSKSFAHFIDVSAEDAKGVIRKNYTEAAGAVFGGYMIVNDGKLPSDKEMIEMSRTTRRFMDINANESLIGIRSYNNEATGPTLSGYMVAHKGKLPSDEEMHEMSDAVASFIENRTVPKNSGKGRPFYPQTVGSVLGGEMAATQKQEPEQKSMLIPPTMMPQKTRR